MDSLPYDIQFLISRYVDDLYLILLYNDDFVNTYKKYSSKIPIRLAGLHIDDDFIKKVCEKYAPIHSIELTNTLVTDESIQFLEKIKYITVQDNLHCSMKNLLVVKNAPVQRQYIINKKYNMFSCPFCSRMSYDADMFLFCDNCCVFYTRECPINHNTFYAGLIKSICIDGINKKGMISHKSSTYLYKLIDSHRLKINIECTCPKCKA